MKAISIFALMVLGTTAFADDSALITISIKGLNADRIAAIATLTSGTTGNNNFTNGSISVSCRKPTPTDPGDNLSIQHYTCLLGKTVKISGDEADQVAQLSYLYSGTSGVGIVVSGTTHVSCQTLSPLIQEKNLMPLHYACVLAQTANHVLKNSIPQNKFATYGEAINLALAQHPLVCVHTPQQGPWGFYKNIDKVIAAADSGRVDEKNGQLLLNFSTMFLGGWDGYQVYKDTLVIKTSTDYKSVISIEFEESELQIDRVNVGTIAKPNIINKKSWILEGTASCQ